MTNAVYVRLLGGLGNQLFQYAMGRALADERHCELVLDPRFVQRKGCISGLAIDEFTIRARYLTEEEKGRYKEPVWKLTRALCRKIRPLFGYFHEVAHYFEPQAVSQPNEIMLSGFWQSQKYFANHATAIRQDLHLKQPLPDVANVLVSAMQSTNSVAMHVRRGDYLSDPKALVKHGVTSASYFQQALAIMIERLENPHIFVFSDDPEWVRQHIDYADITFASDYGFSAEQDLFLISRCKHQIISNSTFSWWGAYLNPNPEKTVIAPMPWFDDESLAQQDILPDSWISLVK